MENSIEKDIKIVENYLANSAINEINSNFFKNGGWEIVDLEIPKSMKHLLSDYKRILKINEVLLKENEKLKNNYINVQDSTNTTFCKVAIPPEPQLPTKTLCESFSKKVRNNNEII